ncbi:low temperature requirement protein A [Microbacterium sp. RD1]|uniref:low temperature requirement protein A n=1 Tax=Microbacterium sp. RD1 TaxID=3457313 RepID=UPI003FA53D9E
MSGRDPRQADRAPTPLELLYDLTYVIAFAAAADQLAHHLGEGEITSAVGAYVFAIFAVSWAWMNFTWFSSAYGNDDALFRVATIVQMIGVVILIFGIPGSFAEAAHAANPNNALLVVGYVVMRVPLVLLWLRAAHQDAANRRTARLYALTIALAQVGWVLAALLPLPLPATVIVLAALALAELIAPVVIETVVGRAPWNPGHVAERFTLLTIITIGEVIASTTATVGALSQEQGWSVGAVTVASAGLVLAAAVWWAYFLIPSRLVLERWPRRIFRWRYSASADVRRHRRCRRGTSRGRARGRGRGHPGDAGRLVAGRSGRRRRAHGLSHLERAAEVVRRVPHPSPAVVARAARGGGRGRPVRVSSAARVRGIDARAGPRGRHRARRARGSGRGGGA